jgi:hypothetical protein
MADASMEDSNPLGSLYDPVTGVRSSARIAALKAAVKASSETNPKPVVDFTLEDGAGALTESPSGGKRKMRGGTIQDALLKGSKLLKDAGSEKLAKFNTAIEHAIGDVIPRFIIDYTKPAVKSLTVGTALKYPTVFANIIATAIRLIPVPSGAGWSEYNAAIGIIADACTQLGFKLGESALTGPVLAGVIGLYIQSSRAVANGRTFGQQCLDDGKASISLAGRGVSLVSDAFKQQIAAFERARRTQIGRNALEDLRRLADMMVMESPTMVVSSMTGSTEEGMPPTERETGQKTNYRSLLDTLSAVTTPGQKAEKVGTVTGKPMERLFDSDGNEIQKEPRNPKDLVKTSRGTLKQYFPSTRKAATSSADATAASSTGSTDMELGGRRRKTRKGKKVRRVTRRMRRFAY